MIGECIDYNQTLQRSNTYVIDWCSGRLLQSSTSLLVNSFGTLQLVQTENVDDLTKDLEKGYPKLK